VTKWYEDHSCSQCGGRGWVIVGRDVILGVGIYVLDDCPGCGGNGLTTTAPDAASGAQISEGEPETRRTSELNVRTQPMERNQNG